MKYKLSELAQIKYGKDHKKLENGNIPVYGTGGLMRKVNNFLYSGESVLIPRKGSLNNVMFVTGKFWTVDTMFWTKINSKKVLPKYLYYCLSRINLSALNVGSAVPSLTIKILNEIRLDIPSLSKQKEIVKKLAPFERKIRLNNQINANLFELTKNYWELFKSNYKTKYLSISELANKVVTGKTPSKKKKEYYENGNVPFIKIPDMHGRVFVTDSTEHLSTVGANSQKSKFIPKGSIIVSCIGTPGLVAMTSKRCQTNQQINSIIIDSKIVYAVFLELQNLRKYIINLGSGGTTISNLNKSDFQNIKLSVPSIDKMCMFDVEVQPIFQQILSNELENKNLDRIKNELLMKLF
ncbi:restriction endonuclease subunit S [Lactobacillus reuteri]|uniref:restriction endonuclease subunit S n=1 Tax=Limosilactobacillus reuteri TaxID=1598 RepID=UPI00146BB148|nr:restriction endonuclease subunit S [Limosilactobacillus reuteri]NMV57686.1 restriction endonuclease subunit S [Limosilactobacillus reuteri]